MCCDAPAKACGIPLGSPMSKKWVDSWFQFVAGQHPRAKAIEQILLRSKSV